MFTIKFETVEQVNTVLQGLAQLPFTVAAPMIESVRKQAEAQMPPPEEPLVEDVEEVS